MASLVLNLSCNWIFVPFVGQICLKCEFLKPTRPSRLHMAVRIQWEWTSYFETLRQVTPSPTRLKTTGPIPTLWPFQPSLLPGLSSATCHKRGATNSCWVNDCHREDYSEVPIICPRSHTVRSRQFRHSVNTKDHCRGNADHLFSTPAPLSPKLGLKLKASMCERGRRKLGHSGDGMMLNRGTNPRRECGVTLLDPPLEC